LRVGIKLIQLHNISGEAFYLNCDLIYRIDDQYDTVVTLTNQKKLIVQEKPEQIVKKVIEYKQEIHSKWRRDSL
jgi:flagellar protein FlbD